MDLRRASSWRKRWPLLRLVPSYWFKSQRQPGLIRISETLASSQKKPHSQEWGKTVGQGSNFQEVSQARISQQAFDGRYHIGFFKKDKRGVA